jgi:ufm1-conjugating enzyme 1
MVDEGTKKTLSSIPLLKTKAGPRDKELWVQRLKEEYQSLIQVKHFPIKGSKSMTAVF